MDTISHKPVHEMNDMYAFEGLPISGSRHTEASHDANGRTGRDAEDHDFGEYLETRLAEGTNCLYSEAMEWMERRLLVRVLTDTNGNKSKACQILGITRGSLRHKIAQLGISIHQTVSVDNANFV